MNLDLDLSTNLVFWMCNSIYIAVSGENNLKNSGRRYLTESFWNA